MNRTQAMKRRGGAVPQQVGGADILRAMEVETSLVAPPSPPAPLPNGEGRNESCGLRGLLRNCFSHANSFSRMLGFAVFALVSSSGEFLSARTITITDRDCELIAAISSHGPLLSWAGVHTVKGEFSNHYVEMYSTDAVLIQYPLDRIPPGQRITRAEWIVPVAYSYPVGDHHATVRRLTAEWGAGVSHQYRMTRPQKVAWAQPGAKGATVDRAAKASAIVPVTGPGNIVINVTQDVELWYSGQAKNHGWLLTTEDPNYLLRLSTPLYGGNGLWKLRITYEPE